MAGFVGFGLMDGCADGRAMDGSWIDELIGV